MFLVFGIFRYLHHQWALHTQEIIEDFPRSARKLGVTVADYVGFSVMR